MRKNLFIAVIYATTRWQEPETRMLLDLLCRSDDSGIMLKRVSIYTPITSIFPNENMFLSCTETELVLRQIDCDNVEEDALINECLSISAYYDCNDSFLLIKGDKLLFKEVSIARMIREIQSNPVPDLGIVAIRFCKFGIQVIESIFFHRNHINLMSKPFPQYGQNCDCAIKYLFELYTTITEVKFYKNLDVGRRSDNVTLEISPCEIVIKDSIIDLFLKYIIYLQSKESIISERESNGHVISMTLYGNKTRYYCSAIRNAQVWPMIYPRWKLRYYIHHLNLYRQTFQGLGRKLFFF